MSTVANPYAGGMLPVVWDYIHPATGQVVRNVEGLCRSVLNRLSAGCTPPLEDADYDESLSYLLGAVIELAEVKWMDRDRDGNPRRDRYPSLGGYLDVALPGALVDHWRSYYGRHGERRVFDARKIDRARDDTSRGNGGEDGFDDGGPGVDRPEHTLPGGADSDPGAWALPREWLEPDGGRGAPWSPQGLGARPGAADPVGVDRRGAGAGGRDGAGVARAPGGAPAFLDCLTCSWRHYPWAPNGVPGWHFPEACLSCGAALAVAA